MDTRAALLVNNLLIRVTLNRATSTSKCLGAATETFSTMQLKRYGSLAVEMNIIAASFIV